MQGSDVTRFGRALAVLAALAIPTAPAAGAAGGNAYYSVPGAPFVITDNSHIRDNTAGRLAFNPAGTLLVTSPDPQQIPKLYVTPVRPDGQLLTRMTQTYRFKDGDVTDDDVAFSPSGQFLAVSSSDTNEIFVFAVTSTGKLTPVAGTPVKAPGMESHGPTSVTFSHNGRWLAASNGLAGSVLVFAVGSSGTLSPVPGSPFQVGGPSQDVAFSPDDTLLASANSPYVGGQSATENNVSVMSVGADGALGTPAVHVIAASASSSNSPELVGFSPAGSLLASANAGSTSVFSVGAGGALSEVAGSPYPTQPTPEGIAFTPGGDQLIETVNQDLVVRDVAGDGTLGPAASFGLIESSSGLAVSSTGLVASSGPDFIDVKSTAPPTAEGRGAALHAALAVGGPAATIATVLKNGGYNRGTYYDKRRKGDYPAFNPGQLRGTGAKLGPGAFTITWTVRAHGHAVLIARTSTHFTFTRIGYSGIVLTRAGRTLLKHAKRTIQITARASFAPTGASSVSASRAVTLRSGEQPPHHRS